MRHSAVRLLVAGVLGLPGASAALADSHTGFSRFVDGGGHITLPPDARTSFVHLGSWAVLDPHSTAKGVHDVYTEASTVNAYRRTGQFPDGTILIKEIRGLGSAAMTTGDPVVFGTAPAVWFVMVKDTRNRFPGNAKWADGWGWALFRAGNPALDVATDYATDCRGCHMPAANTDHVFVQGYPTLRSPGK